MTKSNERAKAKVDKAMEKGLMALLLLVETPSEEFYRASGLTPQRFQELKERARVIARNKDDKALTALMNELFPIK